MQPRPGAELRVIINFDNKRYNPVLYKKEEGFIPLDKSNKPKKSYLTGFTLMELLIVIIIIGILASLALPQFTKTKERALGKEAIANLKLVAAAQRIYRIEAGAYYPMPPGSESNISNINNYLKLSIPSGTTRSWDYAVTGAASTFTLTADRVDTAPSPYKDCRYTLTYDDPDGEPNPSSTTDCP